MIEVQRPEAVYYLPKNLPQEKIDRFTQDGSEPDLHPLLATILTRTPGSVITAGVYVGGLLPTLCKHATHVYAWDCVAEHVRCAGLMLVRNGLRNCTLRHNALGDTEETVTVTTGCEGAPLLGGESCIVENGHAVNDLLDIDHYALRTETVQQTTIDAHFDSYGRVSLIQLDLEGYEIAALVGAQRTIETHRPTVIVEDRQMITHSYLTSLGYVHRDTRSGDRIYVHRATLDK